MLGMVSLDAVSVAACSVATAGGALILLHRLHQTVLWALVLAVCSTVSWMSMSVFWLADDQMFDSTLVVALTYVMFAAALVLWVCIIFELTDWQWEKERIHKQ